MNVKSWLLVVLAFAGVLLLINGLIVPIMQSSVVTSSVGAATDYLEDRGYVVLSAGEFALIAKEATAVAAVANAEAAVVAAQAAAAKVDLFNAAEVFLFPDATNRTITLTAGATNVWSAWTEVVDSAAITLSSKFSASAGYVSDMLFFLPSDAADGYSVELAYGDAKTNLGRVAFWALADGDIAYVLGIKSRRVPSGETIYYRMQSTGANGATVQARFRYFYE
jgi:hypothetical protein